MILLYMIMAHIIDDYYLQGWLAQGKQKSWWRQQKGYSKKYKYDYIVALLMHSFSWSFMIHLPIVLLLPYSTPNLFLTLICNMIIHAIVDHAKANMRIINLIQDQLIHIVQIVFLFLIYTS